MVKWFADIREADLPLVGGKAINLARLSARGLRVPNGFVVLSSAYDAYIASNNLAGCIEEILGSDRKLDEKSEAIKRLFTPDKVERSLEQSIRKAFQQFPGGRVAVRSSSTAEDLPGLSFAGQYTTFLNVTEDGLLPAIVQCWQSLWNARAIDYRSRKRIDGRLSHAVVVQEMIEAKVSGVAFTANPLTGIRDELVVNVSFGLGEAIVNGAVSPDQYIVNKSTGGIAAKQINAKRLKYVYGSQGIQAVNLSAEEQKRDSLNESQIKSLLDTCITAETYYGCPQDIEFAFDSDDQLWLLQSRAITTLFPIDQFDHDGKLRAYLGAGTVLLGMKEPFTPMGFDIMSYMFPTIINVMTARKHRPLTGDFVKHAGSRMYVDITYLMASRLLSEQFANAFSGNDLPLKAVMDAVIDSYGRTFTRQGIRFKLPLGVINYGLSMIPKALKISKIPNSERYDAMIAVGNELYEQVRSRIDRLRTIEDKLSFAQEALVEAFKLSQTQAMYCLDINNLSKIEKGLKRHFGNEFRTEVLVQSLPRCVTQSLMVKLNEYAEYCDQNGVAPSSDDPVFLDIVITYGHRGNTELDLGTKRWREDPSYLLGLVSSYLQNRMYERNLAEYRAKSQQAEAMIATVYERLLTKQGRKFAEAFRRLMVNYRIAAGMREYPKYDIVRFMELGREVLLSVGEELVSSGRLDDKHDVFFVYREDILGRRDLRQLVADHKALYHQEMHRRRIPRIVLNNGATYYTSTVISGDAKVLRGMPLSPGSYEGTIRLVYDPTNTELQEGEVMVTESTNPAWTPLFATAGALIMEYGGPMSHGGIVAREYGIPAVVGISGVTSQLRDGQRVRVNGQSGVVELLD